MFSSFQRTLQIANETLGINVGSQIDYKKSLLLLRHTNSLFQAVNDSQTMILSVVPTDFIHILRHF